MLIKKSERVKHVNSPVCIAYEYGHDDKDISMTLIELNGRYPDKRRVVNKICKEVALVIRDKGKVSIDDKEFLIKERDSVLIKPNQKFFWEGKMKLVMPCQPAFNPEQHLECD